MVPMISTGAESAASERSPWCSRPTPPIASTAIAGDASRLVQRLLVRYEPMKPSPAAATTAAAGPCSSSSRKMKISPAAKLVLTPGMRTGNTPASIAMAVPASTCSQTSGGRGSRLASAAPSATAPPSTTTHQYKTAGRL